MPNDVTTKSEFHDVYEINSTGWQRFNEQACLDNDFALKAQHSYDDMERADRQRRILHTIDKIGRQINLLHGYESTGAYGWNSTTRRKVFLRHEHF